MANIAKINEDMSILDNIEFIEHNQINAKDLWKDSVHLKETGKVFIVKNL